MLTNRSPWHDLGGRYRLIVEASALFDDPGLWGAWDITRWDQSTWANLSETWTDITDYVEQVVITRGRDRWDQRYRAGVARITLDNTTGTFTPDGPPNPWVLPWRPGRTIRVSVEVPDAQPTPTRYVLFTGTVDDSDDTYSAAGFDITTNVLAVDPMGDWQRHNPRAVPTATGVQRTDERVAAALARLPTPPTLIADTGLHTVQTGYLAQSTLEECQRAAEAEGGAFWADEEGRAVFKSRDWLTTDPVATDYQAWIGRPPPGNEAPYLAALDFRISWSTARIRNHVTYARVGGIAQTVTDGVSVNLYGARTHQRLDLLAATDTQVADLATRAVAAGKDNTLRVDQVEVAHTIDTTDEIWCQPPFGGLVKVHVDTPWGWSLEQDTNIQGLVHTITRNDWRLHLNLDQAPPEA